MNTRAFGRFGSCLASIFVALVLAAPAAAQHHGSHGGHHGGSGSHNTGAAQRSRGTHRVRHSGLPRTYHPKYSAGSQRAHHYVAPQRSTAYVGARDSEGRIVRSEEAKRQFMKQTGYPHGRPGYVIDHIVPLAKGGRDDPSNMQWQTIAEGKAKDKWERK